jgi:hypothetical protein
MIGVAAPPGQKNLSKNMAAENFQSTCTLGVSARRTCQYNPFAELPKFQSTDHSDTVIRLSPNFKFHENVNFEERVRYE